jgi:hypothetical protein
MKPLLQENNNHMTVPTPLLLLLLTLMTPTSRIFPPTRSGAVVAG